MIPRFTNPVPVTSMVTNAVLDILYATHSPRITRRIHDILDPVQMEMYAARGAPPQNCFGFIDGTVRPIARPGENQRILYNSHKRVRALKFQSVVLPNGLIANMYGPVGNGYACYKIKKIKLLRFECSVEFSYGEPTEFRIHKRVR